MDWKIDLNNCFQNNAPTYFGCSTARNEAATTYHYPSSNSLTTSQCKVDLINVILQKIKKLLEQKGISRSNLRQMFRLTTGDKLANFIKFLGLLMSNTKMDMNILLLLEENIDAVESTTVMVLFIFIVTINSFYEKNNVAATRTLIQHIKSNKFTYITKLFLYVDSFRLFYSSYFSLPKSLVDSIFTGIKPYTNIEENGVTAYDLSFMCENFIAQNNLKNVVNFMGVFYSDSNYNNWLEEIENSNKFLFGLYATGVSDNPKHWTSFFIDTKINKVFLYDSCSQYIFADEFITFLTKKLNYSILKTHKPHQLDSNYCGLYCLLFLATMVSNENASRKQQAIDLQNNFETYFIRNPTSMDQHMHTYENYFYSPYKGSDSSNATQVIIFFNDILPPK